MPGDPLGKVPPPHSRSDIIGLIKCLTMKKNIYDKKMLLDHRLGFGCFSRRLETVLDTARSTVYCVPSVCAASKPRRPRSTSWHYQGRAARFYCCCCCCLAPIVTTVAVASPSFSSYYFVLRTATSIRTTTTIHSPLLLHTSKYLVLSITSKAEQLPNRL